MNANPFLSAILKARYFKHSSPLDANRGFDPSLTWRSIWGAKSLLIEGLGWRVGRGDQIHIQSERWLMADDKFISPRLVVDNTENFLVWHYINHDTREWRIEELVGTFDGATIEHILSLPLPPTDMDDMLIWMYSKDGKYSVRSGYWLGMNSNATTTSTHQTDDVWNKIWQLQWPPKLKHFLWRACRNSLPVNEVRHFRHIAPNPDCSRCDGGSESICHAILDCRVNHDLWSTHPSQSLIQDAPRSSFIDTLRWLFSHASLEELSSIGPCLWACWMCRNLNVMTQRQSSVTQLAGSLSKMVLDYQLYNQQLGVPHRPVVTSF